MHVPTKYRAIGVAVLAALALAGCGTKAAVQAPPTSATAVKASVTTTTVDPYKHDLGDKDIAVVMAPQLSADPAGNISGTTRLKNISDKTLTVLFTFSFFANADDTGFLGEAQGSAESIAPGQTVTETLVSTDPMFSNDSFWTTFQVDTEY